MLITKTPFRISFFGGGTDYPEYFERHGGAVLGTAIDKSAYLSVSRFYSNLFDYSIRIAYRQVECASSIDELQHAPFRECLRWCNVLQNVEVDYTAELPSFSGLGTSSAFVVGLLNALYAYQGKSIRPVDLTYQAIEIEREVLKESVGCQDQAFAAFGGFNVIEFRTTRDITVQRIPLSPDRISEFEAHLLLLFTGLRRRANEIAAKQIKNIDANKNTLKKMREMVDKAYSILTNSGDMTGFGRLLHEGWVLKSGLDKAISNDSIRDIYKAGLDAGALGGKLLGAGGGGFVLFFVPPEKRQTVRERLTHLEEVPIKVNGFGSHIIHA